MSAFLLLHYLSFSELLHNYQKQDQPLGEHISLAKSNKAIIHCFINMTTSVFSLESFGIALFLLPLPLPPPKKKERRKAKPAFFSQGLLQFMNSVVFQSSVFLKIVPNSLSSLCNAGIGLALSTTAAMGFGWNGAAPVDGQPLSNP